jgi:hypothetical protein
MYSKKSPYKLYYTTAKIMKLEAMELFLIAHPVVEYNSVVAIGDQLAGVRGVKGHSTLIPVISAER